MQKLLSQLSGQATIPADGSEFTEWEGPNSNLEAVLDFRNQRLKIYGARSDDFEQCVQLRELLTAKADPSVVTKVTIYGRPEGPKPYGWQRRGFTYEGHIPGFHEDGSDAWMWAFYLAVDRGTEERTGEHDHIVAVASAKPPIRPKLPLGYSSREAEPEDAKIITTLMHACFSEYPFPIDEERIANDIREKATHFRIVFDAQDQPVATASAELDHVRHSCELTDCATLSSQRGKGLMTLLLNELEEDVRKRFGMNCFYTLARADEPGINAAFAKLGYEYTGRLVNNCRMPNGWECMNIWGKRV